MSFSLLNSEPKKRRRLVKRFPVVFPLVVFLLLLIGYQLIDSSYVAAPSIGIVEVNGVILESEPIIKKLRILENDPSVIGIIIHINSPGGAVSPSQEIYSEILRLKKQKKVYASISSTAASGGYYIAISADKLYANPGSMIGSIGVIIQTFNIKGLLDKIGIQSQVVKAGKNKDIGSMFREMNSEDKELLESVVNDTHIQFIEAVAQNRSLDFEKVKEIADGRVFTGKQAKDRGLIDELGSFRESIEQLKADLNVKGQIKLTYPSDKEEILDSLLELESLFNLKKAVHQSGLFFLATSLTEGHQN